MREPNRAKANRLFRRAYPNGEPNPMTPTIHYRTMRGGYAVELSEGTGMEGQPIFGVTVLDGWGQRNTERSRLFQAREEAEKYIESLRHGV